MDPPSPTEVFSSNPLYERLQSLLQDHAARLLEDYCIRDLGTFLSNLLILRQYLLHGGKELQIILTSEKLSNTKGNDSVYLIIMFLVAQYAAVTVTK